MIHIFSLSLRNSQKDRLEAVVCDMLQNRREHGRQRGGIKTIDLQPITREEREHRLVTLKVNILRTHRDGLDVAFE